MVAPRPTSATPFRSRSRRGRSFGTGRRPEPRRLRRGRQRRQPRRDRREFRPRSGARFDQRCREPRRCAIRVGAAGRGRILSTPRVSTQNNVEAEITQGIQIPIQTVANNTVTVTFKDAALTLLVTPQITASDTVIMRINVENSSPDFRRTVNNIPPIDTQRAITQVLVRDGETTVIGGIYVSREQTIEDRTPGPPPTAVARLALQAGRRGRREPRAINLHHAEN